jgi:hypothetical protein
MKNLLLMIAVVAFTNIFSQIHRIEVNKDTLKMSPIPEDKSDILKWHLLKENLNITIVPSPVPEKYSIITESKHPEVSITNALVLEMYSAKGKLLSKQSIAANGIYEFEIPKNYKGAFIIYKVV